MIPPNNFLPYLGEICNRYDILLIPNERQSGMGRTGQMWAIQHVGVEPDTMGTAKAIASSMPLAMA